MLDMNGKKKLKLHFMENSPLEALLLKDPSSDYIKANKLMKEMFNLDDEMTFSDMLNRITDDPDKQITLIEYLEKVLKGADVKPVVFQSSNCSYFFFGTYDEKSDVIILHARDITQLQHLNYQIKDYTEGLVTHTVGLEMSQRELEKRNLELQDELRSRQLAEELLNQSLDNQRRIIDEMIKTISLMGILKDPYTGTHQQRVANLSKKIAEEMELHHEQVQGIYVAAMLHDIGKISIPSEILSKPGKISYEEQLLIKTHPRISYDILKEIEFPWPVARTAYQHHEKLDGSGYPAGLTANDIILEARIIGVADVVEAISSHRPYREGLGIDFALEEINKHKGTKYDENTVEICVKVFREKKFSFDEEAA